jgi:hypothetical protein
MHYFTSNQLPVMSQLALAFGVSDRWHAPAPCQTWPNRFFAHTGTANGYVNNSPTHFPYMMETVFNRLEEDAKVPWRVYFHDVPQSITLTRLWGTRPTAGECTGHRPRSCDRRIGGRGHRNASAGVFWLLVTIPERHRLRCLQLFVNRT